MTEHKDIRLTVTFESQEHMLDVAPIVGSKVTIRGRQYVVTFMSLENRWIELQPDPSGQKSRTL